MKDKRKYTHGNFRAAFPTKRKCIFCRKQTTRQIGLYGHHVCYKCERESDMAKLL